MSFSFPPRTIHKPVGSAVLANCRLDQPPVHASAIPCDLPQLHRLLLVMSSCPEHSARHVFPDARLGKSHSLSAHHPFLLLVQGDIPQPSRKGYVSEAGLDGVEGTDSSAAPTWVLTSQRTSMMLDAIYPVGVLFWNNKRSLETKDLGGSRLFISSSSSRFILRNC